MKSNYTSIQGAAEYLGLAPKTVRRMISDGQLAGYRIGRRAIRVKITELDLIARRIPTGGDAA